MPVPAVPVADGAAALVSLLGLYLQGAWAGDPRLPALALVPLCVLCLVCVLIANCGRTALPCLFSQPLEAVAQQMVP